MVEDPSLERETAVLSRDQNTPTLFADDREAAHRILVERVIAHLREHAARTFSLGEMADVAIMSPYHFNRVFRRVTGLPPRVFQLLLRLESAKRLLASTQLSIVEVCHETGYTSLGTFTRRFTEMVGVSPSRFRRLAGAVAMSRGEPVPATPALRNLGGGGSLTGRVQIPGSFAGQVFVGAFAGPIPRGRPAGCAIFETPAEHFHIDGLAAGTYYVSAVAVAHGASGEDAVLHDEALRARCGPIRVHDDVVLIRSTMIMRRAEITDVPILLPLGILAADVSIPPGTRYARSA
jgi:AraC family transcriptional regulator